MMRENRLKREEHEFSRAAIVLSKLVRVITVPPVLIGVLLALLWFCAEGVFSGVSTLVFSFLFLAVIPVLAYPVSVILPSVRRGGRNAQRSLAFVFSLVGYLGVVVYGFAAGVTRRLMLLYLTYFLSALILTFFNKALKIRASGHACAVTGPLLLPAYYIGWQWLAPCLLVLGLVYLSSLILKRHSLRELLTGSACSAAGFLLCLLLFSI